MPTLWVATHVADEDGYVDFTRPFVADTEFRNAIVATITDDVVAQGGLPAAVKPVVERALRGVATQTAKQPGFLEAWEESQRRTHRLTFGPDANTDRLTADIGPIATFVAKQVAGNLPVRVAIPDKLLVPIYDAPDREVIDQVDKTTEPFAHRAAGRRRWRRCCASCSRGVASTPWSAWEPARSSPAACCWPARAWRCRRCSTARPRRRRSPARCATCWSTGRPTRSTSGCLGIAVVGAVVLVIALLGRALPGR